ncbi:MAG: N-acetylmuramoyl-L-alanine amidase [Aeromonas sp.]
MVRILLACCVWLLSQAALANDLKSVRVWPSPDNTRVVLDLSEQPRYEHFSLTGPHRLVIDLPSTTNLARLENIGKKSELISKVRLSTPPAAGSVRLVIELASAIKPVIFPLAPAGPYGHRLVIDLPYEEKRAAAAAQATPPPRRDEVVIAIDPGHGGEDPGSIGPKRTYEKRVTLAVSKRLAKLINAEPGMRAALTRQGDYFVDLNKRSALARNSKADLLISVHADSFHNPKPRGASVWVLSTKRANREMGSWLEKQERQGELLGGVGKVLAQAEPNAYLAQTFLDLSMDKSRAEGYEVSRHILRAMGNVARLHKKAPEHASLAVLKAPDIPSVLVETGFISNPAEEKLLADTGYQTRMAQAIFEGIRNYYRAHPTKGGVRTASAATPRATPVNGSPPRSEGARVRHVVRRGESLSYLAQKHGVSQATLVEMNNLRSREIQIGQVLQLPALPAPSPAPRHRVKSGDSLSRLAEKYGVSQARLVEVNQLKSRDIQVGQVLTIPEE